MLLADTLNEGTPLQEGKNVITFDYNFNPVYASELVQMYPEIASIAYNETGEELGFANVFGGIGDNFIISSGNTYEITTTREVNLNLR